MRLPWDSHNALENTEVEEVAEKFIGANCYNPTVPGKESLQC
jgi:putative transposase